MKREVEVGSRLKLKVEHRKSKLSRLGKPGRKIFREEDAKASVIRPCPRRQHQSTDVEMLAVASSTRRGRMATAVRAMEEEKRGDGTRGYYRDGGLQRPAINSADYGGSLHTLYRVLYRLLRALAVDYWPGRLLVHASPCTLLTAASRCLHGTRPMM